MVAHLAAVVAGAQSYPGDPDLGSALGAFVATWGDQLALLAVLSGSLAVALGAAASLYEETELAIAGAMS